MSTVQNLHVTLQRHYDIRLTIKGTQTMIETVINIIRVYRHFIIPTCLKKIKLN